MFLNTQVLRCEDEEVVKIGANLKRERERAFLSQRELAKRAGIWYPTVSRIEKDHTEPHPRTIRKLAEALGIEPAELVKE